MTLQIGKYDLKSYRKESHDFFVPFSFSYKE